MILYVLRGGLSESLPNASRVGSLGACLALLNLLYYGNISMSFSSKITILKVNEVEKGISAKSGKPWERHTAECMLLDDSGQCLKVGKLDIAPALRGSFVAGTFTATFGLDVPDYGLNQGRVTALLTGLVRVPVSSPAAVASGVGGGMASAGGVAASVRS